MTDDLLDDLKFTDGLIVAIVQDFHTNEVLMCAYMNCEADNDAILLRVEQVGGACHTGYRSCFYRRSDGRIVGEKVFHPEEVY
ncbi:hypothetical protein B6V01_004010 [Methanosarcinales archaeon ex4572_44]|nr:MAG: hypothetical protein B6V01_004010 [Methanosarcinales archaeon ex4572_44]